MEIKYIKTDWEFIYAGSDGELYTTYYPGFTLKKAKDRKNTKTVTIRLRGNKKYLSVMREIAIAFIPNPNNHKYVKAIDGDYMNTSPDNIIWSKSNRMDYEAFAIKKTGMVYKSYIGDIVGDYTVVSEDSSVCTLSCLTCGDEKILNREKIKRNKGICHKCKDYSLDISSLYSTAFENWTVTGEDGTEGEKALKKKKLKIQCNCCEEVNTIPLTSFNATTLTHYCEKQKKDRTTIRNAYKNMKVRCYNSSSPDYKNYGARGITICEEWLSGSESFITWALDNGYERGLSIERINNDEGYSPDNCKWATRVEQNQNQKTTVLNKDLVLKIKNTDWGNMDNRQIADALGLEDRVKGGRVIGTVRKGQTWKDI